MSDVGEALAKDAVKIIEKRFIDLKLNPYNFDSPIALCELLQWADEYPERDVSRWILSAPREKLWKRINTPSGEALVEGDDITHALFREAWQNFLEGSLPVM